MRAERPTRTMRKSVSPLTGATLHPVKTRVIPAALMIDRHGPRLGCRWR